MSKRKKQPHGNPARNQVALDAVTREFARWMNETDETFSDPSTARADFKSLVAHASQVGLHPLDPGDTEGIVDVLLDLGTDADGMLALFHDYVHFRLETAPGIAWVEAHAVLEEMLADDDGLPAVITDALADAELLDPGLRQRALAELRIVARVRDLLEWVDQGRAVTTSGSLRRADIAPVASLIGITARGVAKLPPGEYRGGAVRVDGEAQVRSMWDLPPLAAWWEALRAADLIDVTPTRVRPGSAAPLWLAAAEPPFEDATALVAVFVAQLLTGGLQLEDDVWSASIVRVTLAEAVAALDPEADAPVAGGRTRLDDLLLPRARGSLEQLADAGLVVAEAGGRFRVPELLRGTFARGVILAMSFVAEALGAFDEVAYEVDDDASPFDDPEVKAQMARLGIVHTPGMAAEMLRELAPLLAEDGIDLDNLGDTDLDAVNAALARATERRNLELATPVGERRAMAFTVHRLVTEAFAEGSFELARVVIDGIQPDPVGNLPSVAQVIGVGLGALDEWNRDPAIARTIAQAAVPEWEPTGEQAARDILRAARTGTAFDQMGALIARHRGKAVLEGSLLAVAAAVIARAAHEDLDVRDLAGRLLVDE